jgi:periplasmic divalent cation tolerance protein
MPTSPTSRARLPKYIVVVTTCADEEAASRIAGVLVERKLAACVQASAITSTYRWQGAIETAREVRLMIKAKSADYDAIQACIVELHSYQTPEVIALPVVAGSRSYLDWIDVETRGSS